jgi:hypothetical protein
LSDDRRDALGDFLRVLSVAFPGPKANRAAVAALLAKVGGEAAPGGGPDGVATDAEWEAFLSAFRLAGKVSTADNLVWSALCDPTKRSPGAADAQGAGRHITVGYTCGLWTLFHMVTMAAPRAGLTAGQPMRAIRAYVAHFFGCSHCRDHFLAMYDACELGRCDVPDEDEAAAHRAASLWLWRVHNAVNVRVAADALQDEARAAAERTSAVGAVEVVDLDPAWSLWPPEAACPACRKPGRLSVAGRGDGRGRGFPVVEWNEDAVFAFLTDAYDAGLWGGTVVLSTDEKRNGLFARASRFVRCT